MCDDDRFRARRGAHDLYGAAHNDEKWRRVADVGQHVALRRLPASTVDRDPLDLRLGQRREQTVVARVCGHVFVSLLSARVVTRAARQGAGWPDS